MPVLRSAVAAVLSVLSLAVPAAAQESSNTFMSVLRHLPARFLEPGSKAVITYSNPNLALQRGSWPDAKPGQPLAGHGVLERVGLPGFEEALFYSTAEDMQRAVGFLPAGIIAAAQADLGAEHAQLVLLYKEAVSSFSATMARQEGYASTAQGKFTMFTRGEEDLVPKPILADFYDPFIGARGMPARIALTGQSLYEANGWDLLNEVVQRTELAPEFDAIARVLDDPGRGDFNTDGFAILQARVLLDPAAMSPSGGGTLPRWQVGLLADLAAPNTYETLAIFVYGGRDSAEKARDALTYGWANLPLPEVHVTPAKFLSGAEVSVEIVGAEPYAVVLSIKSPAPVLAAQGQTLTEATLQGMVHPDSHSPDAFRNRSYEALLRYIDKGAMPHFAAE